MYAVSGFAVVPAPASTSGPVKLPVIAFPTSSPSGKAFVPTAAAKYVSKTSVLKEYIAPASYWRSVFEFTTTSHFDAESMAIPVGKKKRGASGLAGSGPKPGGKSVGGPGKLHAQSRAIPRAAERCIEGGGR